MRLKEKQETDVSEAKGSKYFKKDGAIHLLEVMVLSRSVKSDFCNPMDCSSPGFSVHGILQARMLEWIAMPFSRGSSSQLRNQTQVLCIAGGFFTV